MGGRGHIVIAIITYLTLALLPLPFDVIGGGTIAISPLSTTFPFVLFLFNDNFDVLDLMASSSSLLLLLLLLLLVVVLVLWR
jgi:hypothetical protein